MEINVNPKFQFLYNDAELDPHKKSKNDSEIIDAECEDEK